MPKADSVYVIGEGVQGRITIDLDKIPHVIIGGSTGSGKTQLLRFLLMQAINKNEVVGKLILYKNKTKKCLYTIT